MKVVLFLILFSYSSSLHLHSSLPILKRDLVNVVLSRKSSEHERSRRHVADIPDITHINIHNGDFQKSFQVERHHHRDSNIPLYVNGELSTLSFHPKVLTQFYQCVNRECLFQAENIMSINTTAVFSDLLLFGTFYIDGKLHILESSEPGLHTIIIPNVNTDFIYDSITASAKEQDEESMKKNSRDKRAAGNFVIELLLVLDYSAYKFWFDEKNGVRNDAIEAIRQFYAFLIKGMDLRYQNLPGATFTIDIVHAGLYIIEDINSAVFVENLKNCSTSTKCTIDSNALLAAFKTWKDNTALVPSNDHAMLFTRYDLTTQSDGDATGYAYIGSMCSDQSVSVIEEDFSFISQTIAGHELGHSLSAVHDGVQNACSATDQYIMAAISSASTGSTANNPWIFSTCSVQEMNARLNIIVSNNNCLITSVSSNHNALDSYLTQNIGQLYSIDQQCKLALGQASYGCRAPYATAGSFESVCTGLWCKSTVLTDKCSLILPAERTSCGSQKWCEADQCITSVEAPVRTESCVFGDQTDEVVTGFTCASLIAQKPYQCYTLAVAQQCCQSCITIATGITGCEYGDKTDCSAVTSRSSCYVNGDNCCKTCAPYVTNIANCQYGDLALNCGDIQNNFQCYGTTGTQCCQTCDQYKTAITDCGYGDKTAGCVRTGCSTYSEQTRNSCCKTCDGITVSSSAAATSTVSMTTTTTKADALPGWVLPVAISAGGLILVVVIITIICCVRMTRRLPDKPSKKQSRGRQSHDRVRSHHGHHNRHQQSSRDVMLVPPTQQPRDGRYPLTRGTTQPPHSNRQLSRGVIPPHEHNRQRPNKADMYYMNGGYGRY